jgi:hypothetical protein
MRPSEIIAADAERNGINPEKVLQYVGSQVHNKKGVVISAGNSVLLLVSIGDDCMELHLFTQDSPLSLMKSLAHFIDVIRQSKTKFVYGDTDNTGILEMLKRLGVDVQESDRPSYSWMAKV